MRGPLMDHQEPKAQLFSQPAVHARRRAASGSSTRCVYKAANTIDVRRLAPKIAGSRKRDSGRILNGFVRLA